MNFFEKMQQNHGYNDTVKDVNSAGIMSGGFAHDAWGDQASLNKIYEKMEIVYRCVSFIATNLSNIPIKVYKYSKDGKDAEDLTEHPDFNIFRKPNPFQTYNDFWLESISRLQLQGELFWSLALDNKGKPIQMYADWQSDKVKVYPSAKEMIDSYEITRNGKTFKFENEEVFFIKYFNPYDNIRGLAPLKSASNSVILDINAVEFNKKFFSQGMKLSGILSTEDELSNAEATRFKESFESMYNGINNMNKVAVLWSGIKFDPISSMSLSDAQFSELRDMNEQKILYTFGLYPEVLGIGNATYQNVKYYRRMVWTETLQPIMAKMISMINTFFLPRLTNDPNIKVIADYSNVEALKEDLESKSKIYSDAVARGVLTRNEMRAEIFKKEPIENDEMNTTAVATTKPTGKSKAIKKDYLNAKTYEDRTVIWKSQIKKVDKQTASFKKNMVNFFKEQEKRVLKNVDKFIRKDIGKVILESENILFDLKEEEKRLAKEGQPWIIEAYAAAVEEISELIDAGAFDYTSPSVRNALNQRVAKFSKFVNEETDKQIKGITDKIFQDMAGEPITDIKNALKEAVTEKYKQFTDTRANLIARTEAMGANNAGLQDAMTQGGIENKMWITSRDDRVRDSHASADGQVVGTNDVFTLGDGSQFLFPSDYNERCSMIPTKQEINI